MSKHPVNMALRFMLEIAAKILTDFRPVFQNDFFVRD